MDRRTHQKQVMNSPFHIFCCYARSDQPFLIALQKGLVPLQRKGLITVSTDIDISPGEDWEQQIHHYLNTAHVILLLISRDFIASDYCYDIEMQQAIKRHEAGEALVIPILLRPCAWQDAPFGKIQVLPTDARPITSWLDKDSAYLDVVNGIEEAIENLLLSPRIEALPAQQVSVSPEKPLLDKGKQSTDTYLVQQKSQAFTYPIVEKLKPPEPVPNSASVAPMRLAKPSPSPLGSRGDKMSEPPLASPTFRNTEEEEEEQITKHGLSMLLGAGAAGILWVLYLIMPNDIGVLILLAGITPILAGLIATSLFDYKDSGKEAGIGWGLALWFILLFMTRDLPLVTQADTNFRDFLVASAGALISCALLPPLGALLGFLGEFLAYYFYLPPILPLRNNGTKNNTKKKG